MSVSFRILPDRGLVFVRYEGIVQFDESLAAFSEYARHPDCAPGQKQLVDLSRLTGYDKDFTKLLKVQARKADVFATNGAETLMVYYAPTRLAKEIARLVLRSWEPVDSVIALMQEDEAHALELLGQPESCFEALWAHEDEA